MLKAKFINNIILHDERDLFAFITTEKICFLLLSLIISLQKQQEQGKDNWQKTRSYVDQQGNYSHVYMTTDNVTEVQNIIICITCLYQSYSFWVYYILYLFSLDLKYYSITSSVFFKNNLSFLFLVLVHINIILWHVLKHINTVVIHISLKLTNYTFNVLGEHGSRQ